MSARNMAKRTAAGTLALAVCLGGGALALAGAAQADANFKFDTRVAGDDRYATAVAASKAAFPTDGKTENVVLVNGFATVDGLTASYLAGVANAPILYVSDKGADDATKAEIKRLGAKNVWLVGGTTVIPTSVEAAIKGDGYSVTRINGSDRYETAKLIAEAGAKISGKQPSKVFVASGTSFADALAVSPVAYAKGYAIALTEKDSTSDFTKKELGNIGTDNKILVGGTAVVSDKVKADLSITTRVAGDDRAVTANLVADWAKSSEGFSKANAALVGGTNGNGADSLVASALLGKSSTTLHFAGWDATNVYLKDHAAELTGKGFVFGGKAAVPGDQVDKAQSAAQMIVSNEQLKVEADGKTTVELVNNAGSVKYVIKGLGDAKVDLALFAPSSLNRADSVWSFSDANSDKIADRTAPTGATISVVNGVSTTGSPTVVDSVKPIDGVITFTVAASAATQVVPVAYVDADDKTGTNGYDLDVDAKGIPTEKYGFGQQAGFVPAEATFGSHTGVTIAANGLNADGGYFVGGGATYYFDDNDTFQYGGVGVTKGQFASVLLGGGTVSVSYATDAKGVSTFNVTAASTPSVSGVKAVAGGTDGKDVTLTWTAPTNATGIVYDVWRSLDNALTSADTKISNDQTALSYTDSSLADNTYYYFVVTENTTTGAQDTGVISNSVTTPLASDVVAPLSVQTVTNDNGFSGVLDAGDVISLGVNEAIKLTTDPGLVVTTGTDSVTLDSSNSTFSLEGQALKVTVNKTPTFGTANTTLTYAGGTTVSNTRGIADSAGNRFSVASGNTVAVAPTAISAPAIAGTNGSATFTVTFTQAIDVASLTAADLTLPAGKTVTGISFNAAQKVATVTVSSNLVTGDSVTLKAKSVQDAAHTVTGPTAAASQTI